MTASNHTYSRFVGWSSQPGTGMPPQSMSRVMARGLDVLEDVLAEADHVGSPQAGRLALVEPAGELRGQRRQVQEPVRGLDELRGGLAVDAGDRIDEVRGIELVAAGVALVAAGAACRR